MLNYKKNAFLLFLPGLNFLNSQGTEIHSQEESSTSRGRERWWWQDADFRNPNCITSISSRLQALQVPSEASCCGRKCLRDFMPAPAPVNPGRPPQQHVLRLWPHGVPPIPRAAPGEWFSKTKALIPGVFVWVRSRINHERNC